MPEVQWERLLPAEFRARQAERPVCYLPLGTVEWHGEHNALGLDSLKAHALCCLAARRAGGIVHPPVYGGMGGLPYPATVVIEPENAWENHLLRPWLEQLCAEFARQGFRGIILLTGHYGHNQQIVVRETAARMSERLDIPVLGTPEYFLAHDLGYLGDHADIGETSLLWHLHPDLVAIDRVDSDPDYGPPGRVKAHASRALGERYADRIVERLAAVATAMPTWDLAARAAFVAAERALVTAQVTAWRRTGDPWRAWARLIRREQFGYGALLAAGDFAGIKRLADELARDDEAGLREMGPILKTDLGA